MGDTFPDGYFNEDYVSAKIRLLREDIEGIKGALEDLTERVSRIEARQNLRDYISYKRHRDSVDVVDDDFSPMSDEDTKKLMQD